MYYKIEEDGSLTYFQIFPKEYIISNRSSTMLLKNCMPFSIFSNKYGTVISKIRLNFYPNQRAKFWPDGMSANDGLSKMTVMSDPSAYSFLVKFKNLKNLVFSFTPVFKKEFKLPFFDKIEIPISYQQEVEDNGLKFADDFKIIIKKGEIRDLIKGEKVAFVLRSDENNEIEIIIGKDEKNLEEKNTEYLHYLNSLVQNKDLSELEKSEFLFTMHTAFSSIKDYDGNLALAAGVNYSFPNRTYFRDSFWTIQPIMKVDPKFAKNQILFLSEGVHEDGSCPSGVMKLGEEELAFIRSKKNMLPKKVKEFYKYEKDWWSNHHDSGGYYIILLSDYINNTGDLSILKERFPDGTVLDKIGNILKRYISLDTDNDLLFEKPYDSNDWADNVYKNGAVTYDLAIQIKAFEEASLIYDLIGDKKIVKDTREKYQKMKHNFNKKMWNEKKGYFNDFIGDYLEDHLNIDTILALLFDIADEDKKRETLDAMERLLETKNNKEQKFGDWGVMSVWPFFKSKKHLFSKSIFPYRYHNGSDWPYLSSIYALVKKREGMDYSYPLTRWWEYSLEKGWINPVEYYSPIYARGSLNQGWSSMAATLFF
jgi:glycogen debranching enzyme